MKARAAGDGNFRARISLGILSDRRSGTSGLVWLFQARSGLSRSGGRATKRRTSDRVSKRRRNSGRFRVFSTYLLQILGISYAIVHSRNNKAVERTKLSEADMETRKAPGRNGAVRRARGDAGEPGGRNKKRPGGSAQVLDRARFRTRKSKLFPWLDLAGLGWIWLDWLTDLDSASDFPWMFCTTALVVSSPNPSAALATGPPSKSDREARGACKPSNRRLASHNPQSSRTRPCLVCLPPWNCRKPS